MRRASGRRSGRVRRTVKWAVVLAVSAVVGLAVLGAVVGRTETGQSKAGSKPTRAIRPNPPTGRKAIARVRANPNTSREASPFKRELRWRAEWRGDRWWVIGLFESPWGVRFVVDAAIIKGAVHTYIDYLDRPSRAWVRAKARAWGLRTLYARLAPADAIEIIEKNPPGDDTGTIGLGGFTTLDAAAKLATDTAQKTGWYFAFYVQDAAGKKFVYAVTGLSGNPAEEGTYVDGYGFGSQPTLQDSVPLNLVDWIRSVAKARGWQPSNLP